MQELDGTPFCDDGTMPADDPVVYVYDLTKEAFQRFGMDTNMARKLGPLLAEAGFSSVQCKVKKVPIGAWAYDKTLRLIGLYQKTAVLDLLPAFAGRTFTALGLSQVESQVTIARARRGLEDTKVHRYFNYYFWYAQKPETESAAAETAQTVETAETVTARKTTATVATAKTAATAADADAAA